ncbi:MAG: Eco57I restriction-modification methylase domain-containing protein, partial [Anaerolineae bacterium]
MLYHQARSEVERLVERFSKLSERNRRTYNEPATRQAFILPLFRALGWNTDDIREVSPEEKVSRGSVDFAFKLRGIPRFFLETKKIQADLEDPKWAFQAINYAWNKGVTWAVLSDFEGLKIFNAEWLEKIPARAIFKDLNWQEYLDRFDDLWLLSRPAMEEGLLDKEAEKVGRRTKKAPVTRQLFADLTEWRRELFRHLRPYNPDLSIEQIDQAVQRILDRLIFIRTCEDRELEERRLLPLLRQFQEGSRRVDLLKELKRLFREFDETYNARLFAPHFCENLASEPAPFERIINELYDVPDTYATYNFSAIDADVLGAIYEQYLGYRVQDPEGKQVVDKRAKRKAQGIYYTPQFVVRYIVRETLGRFLEENDYERARDVRVLDMACGSGSFLIEAFDALDKYFSEKNAPRAEPRDEAQHPASPAGDFHDYARRMEILSKNLYGVDLDAQAVEIAQLNLLLKALNQKGRLPELENIRQGNSLISGTEEELRNYFGESWQDKRPFNWEEEFPEAMERGGFDVIVGNPP